MLSEGQWGGWGHEGVRVLTKKRGSNSRLGTALLKACGANIYLVK